MVENISWLFPAYQHDPAYSPAHIADALQLLFTVNGADALDTILAQQSAILLDRHTLTTLYLTAVRSALDGKEEIAQELSDLLHMLGSVQRYGLAETHQRLDELVEEEQIILLSHTDLVALFTQIRDTLARDEYPDIQATLFLDIGDQQALIFDETQEQEWLDQAVENYASALSLETRTQNPLRWAYIHMRRGIVELCHQGDKRADFIEQAIADLEAALTVDFSETEPQLRAAINQYLARAYNERVYDQHPNNLQRALAAYRAALDDFPLPTAPRERLAILQDLIPLHIELRDEPAAREVFAEMSQAAREMERLAMKQLENEERQRGEASSADGQEQFDDVTVNAILDEWLGLADQDQLFAFLVEFQDVLVSDEALIHLRALLSEKATLEQDGRAEHIDALIRLLEGAQASSIELAWSRYLLEVLPAVEAALLLSLAESFQEANRRIVVQRDLLLSRHAGHAVYAFACFPGRRSYAARFTSAYRAPETVAR